MSIKINWDAMGITASVACAIHCAVLPLFLTSLPLFGVNIIENLPFEYFMIGLAFVIGVYSLYNGFIKQHHSWLPLLLFAGGIVLLLIKVSVHEWRYWLLVPAVLLIVSAHFLNFWLPRKRHQTACNQCNHS